MFKYEVHYGSIYLVDESNKLHHFLEEPAILICISTGSIYKIGNISEVQKKLDEIIKKDTSGIIADDILMFEFDLDNWSKEQVAEELSKMLNNSGYAGLFIKNII